MLEAFDADGGQRRHLFRRRGKSPRRCGRNDYQRRDQQDTDHLHGQRHNHRQQQHETQIDGLDRNTFDQGQFLINGRRQQRPPQQSQSTGDDGANAVNQRDIEHRRRQHVAEQIRN